MIIQTLVLLFEIQINRLEIYMTFVVARAVKFMNVGKFQGMWSSLNKAQDLASEGPTFGVQLWNRSATPIAGK